MTRTSRNCLPPRDGRDRAGPGQRHAEVEACGVEGVEVAVVVVLVADHDGVDATLWGAKTALATSDLQLPEADGGPTGREAGHRSCEVHDRYSAGIHPA